MNLIAKSLRLMALSSALGIFAVPARTQTAAPSNTEGSLAPAANAVAPAPAAEEPGAAVSAECDRPGKVHWVQFEREARHAYLLKVNSDDGSRSILRYELLVDGSEQCGEAAGPYAPGNRSFLVLEGLEIELQDCCAVQEKPWLYLITNAQDLKSNFKKRIADLTKTLP